MEYPDCPVAVQALAEVHDTASRTLEGWGLGVCRIVHAVPSHASASVLPPEDPTAVHTLAEVHDTPFRALRLAGGLGAARNDHAVPFHASARVSWRPALLVYQPTAMHARGEVHDTPFRTPAEAPGGSGAGLMDQRVPFHSSASGVSPELPK